jgi:hypothetical protein
VTASQENIQSNASRRLHYHLPPLAIVYAYSETRLPTSDPPVEAALRSLTAFDPALGLASASLAHRNRIRRHGIPDASGQLSELVAPRQAHPPDIARLVVWSPVLRHLLSGSTSSFSIPRKKTPDKICSAPEPERTFCGNDDIIACFVVECGDR